MEMNDLQPIILPGIPARRPLVIAGPCSAETEEQVLAAARALAAQEVKIFRAGIWKPRTKPGGFEGVGVEGLRWLQRVKAETGMYVSTEVATERHVFEALKAGVDLLWIGARTSANPFAMQELGQERCAAWTFRCWSRIRSIPISKLRIGAIERLYNAGLRRLGSHPPRIQQLRPHDLPQPAPVAHPDRTAPPAAATAAAVRSEPHRRINAN